MINISRTEKFNNSKVSAGISIFFALTIIVSGFPPNVFIVDAAAESSFTGNTGFEPWYYYAGDIVNTGNGNLYISAKDISIKARGFDIEIIRSYSSHSSGISGPFGFGWTFNYNIYLVKNPDSSVTLYDEDGSAHTFKSAGENDYTAPPGIHSELKKNPDGSFILRFKDGSKYNFDSNGKLINIIDTNNNHLNFDYISRKLTRIYDDSGSNLTFTYDSGDRITSITDPLGRLIRYEYDVSDLVKITDATGNSDLYFYYDNHKLKSHVDRVNNIRLFSYDESHKVRNIKTSLYDRSTNSYLNPFILFSFVYDDNTTYVTDAMGHTTSVQINNAGNPIKTIDSVGGVTTLDWDSDMNPVSVTDANGNTYIYQYDRYGNLVKETDPLGNSTIYTWETIETNLKYLSILINTTNARGFTTNYKYDLNGNLNKTTDATGNSSYMEYNFFGELTQEIDPMGYQTYYTYDINGFLIKSTDAKGYITKYIYDAVGRLIGIIDANGHKTTTVYDNNDNPIEEIDSLGNKTQYSYNPAGNLINIIDANGHNKTYKGGGLSGGLVDSLNNKVDYFYDKNGNLIKVTNDKNGSTTMAYDALGRVTSITDALGNTEFYKYDAVSNLISQTDRNGNTITFTYDELNRQIRKTDAMDHITQYSYDAVDNVISETDANNQTTSYEYDPLDRVIRITDALENSEFFSHDANDNLVKYIDQEGNSVKYVYDELNKLIKIVTPIGYETSYKYDSVGNLVNRIDANANKTTYSYDELDRLILTSYPNGKNISKSYDAVGNIIKIINTERLGSSSIKYDKLDRVLSITTDYDIFSKTINYTYDANGNTVKVQDPQGGVTYYSYDVSDRLMNITNPLNQVTAFNYDNEGKIARVNYSNGIITSYSYDPSDRLLGITSKKSGGDIVSGYSYTYDNLINKLGVTEENGDVTRYEYDAVYRLINATYPSGKSTNYAYDRIGNRISESNSTSTLMYSYDPESRLLSANGIGYSYDKNGNLVKKTDGTINQYDYENRLTGIILPDKKEINYKYSPDGNRLSKIDDTGTTNYFYDSEDVIFDMDENGLPKAKYTYGPGIDQPVSMNRDGITSYFHSDGVGSITLSTDLEQKPIAKYRYDAFGAITENSGTIINRYKFTGREYDENSGLYYYRARYYDPETGRFLQKDPLMYEFAGVAGSYIYVSNNPINWVDPSGLGGIPPASKDPHKLIETIRNRINELKLTGLDEGRPYGAGKFTGTVGALRYHIQTIKEHIEGLKNIKGYGSEVDQLEKELETAYKRVIRDRMSKLTNKGTGKLTTRFLKKAGKKIPIIGIGVSLFFFKEAWAEKGFFGAAGDAVLDATPYVGWVKLGYEVKFGEIIPGLDGGPGGDNPDDNYDASTLVYTSNTNSFNYKQDSQVAILSNGFYTDFSRLLVKLGESSTPVDVGISEKELSEYPVFVIPSGGLYGLGSLKSFKSKLEKYVSNGGTLIVYAQQHGYDYNAAPGKLGGFGWLEDQSCQFGSVGITTYHPILSGQDSVTSDVNVDGYFTTYPDNATILLSRTKNGMPAMLMYNYGNGTVIATTAYTDWAYGHNAAAMDEKNLVRDMITWAKDQKEISEYGSGDAINIPINVTSYIDLTANNVVFRMLDPDKKVVDTVNAANAISPFEIKTVNAAYTTPSKLGIWTIDYSLMNNSHGEVQGIHNIKKFAVSKYKENPNGFAYQGSQISFAITSDAEQYPYGSPAVFTFHIWNKGSIDKNIKVTWGSIHHSWYGIIPPGWDDALNNTITVPSQGYASFTYVLPKVVDLDRFRAKFYDGNNYLGGAEKGFWMFKPTLSINVQTDKTEYARGENGTIILNINNMQSSAYNTTIVVRTLNPENFNIFEKTFDLNISASSKENRNIEFSIPSNDIDGTHLLIVEAYKGTNKIGSNSTFFKVSKNYIVRLDFDNPFKTYRIRQNMGMDVSLLNTAASALNTQVNISIPDINFNDSKYLKVNPTQTEKIHYNVTVPENLNAGKHNVIITVGVDNSEKEYNFVIPDSKLALKMDKLNYDTGDEIPINITNTGGVDSKYNYSIKLFDPYNAIIYNGSGEESLFTGETKVIRFRIPEGITSGYYRLIVNGIDIKTNEIASLWKSIHINGFSAVLTSTTDKKGYSVDENISVLTNITNLNYDIIDGTLNLKIYSNGQLTSMKADSRGKEFFLVNTENYASGYESAIFITSEVNTTGLVEIPGIGFTRSFTVTANKITTVNVPINSMVSGSNRIENKGIRVTAADEIAVYFLNPGVPVYTNDAYLGLPTDILDKEYLVLTYPETFGGYPSEIAIAAPYNDTIITIIPSITTGTRIAKVPYTVGLNQSQTYTLQSDNLNEDLTGTVIQSNQPVSVFAGVKCVNIPAGYGYCDHIVEQLTPTSTWGKNIDTFPFKPRQNNKGDFLRILASIDDTIVTINGSVAGTINRGQFLETIIKKPVEISTSEPVLVSQYMTGSSYEGRIGDPSSSLVTPVEQFLSDYTFLVPISYAENYVNVIAPSSSLKDLMLDGSPVNAGVFSSYGTKGLSAGTISLSEGSHTIKGSAPFGIYVYGYNQDVSYAYPGGLALRTLRESLVWEKNIKLNLSKSEIKNLSNMIDISKEMPNLVGKFDLLGSLYSNSSQKINQSNIYSFFITNKNTSFTLETNKKIYRPNELITIYGTVQNNGVITRTYNLSLKADDAVLSTETFTLNAGGIYDFSKGTISNKSFTLEGTVDGTTITESIKIEPPVINVTINSPDIVDRKEFDIGLLIENKGNVSVNLGIAFNSTWNVTIPEKESKYIETKMKINKNITLNVTISGDVNQTIQKEIILGERAHINVTPQNLYLEGTVDIPFEVKNTGIYDSEFNATFSIGSKTISKALYIPKVQSINDSISFNLTRGKYILEYTTPFEEGNVTINVETGPEFIVTSAPSNMTFKLGQSATMQLSVKNIGGVEGSAELHLTIPGIFEDVNSTWIAQNSEENITFNFVIPDDLEEKSYKVFYELDGNKAETSLSIQGVKIDVNASLDKNMYLENDTAILNIEVKNLRNFDLELFSRVKFNDYDRVQDFNLTGLETKTLSFNVPVHFTGDKIFYSVYMASGRSLYINSIYAYEKPEEDSGITLYTDKQVYLTGENVNVFVNVTEDGTLNMTAPGFTDTRSLTAGDSPVISFNLPQLKSGTYYIDYTFGNFSSSYPFDVNGYSAKILEFTLDKEIYDIGDSMNMKMLIEANRNFSGALKIWIYGQSAEDSFELNRDFVKGENRIELNRTLNTSWSGIHSIVYGVYADIPGNSLVLLASGAEYFDVVDHVPPLITITSPQNVEYTSSSVPLIFTIDDTSDIDWEGYSLDGAENTTISASTLLTDLVNGNHAIIAYARDSAGNTGSASVSFMVNVTQEDIMPPVISNVSASGATDSAGISWETDEASSSLVKYGTTSGNYPFSASSAGMVLLHSMSLTGLSPETKYYYVVESADANGNSAQSSELNFPTLALTDMTKPTIDSVAVYPANTTAGSKVDIKVAASDNIGVTGVTADGYAFTYSDGYWKGNITASSSPGTYNVLIKANDAAGNNVTTTVFYTVVKPTGSLGVGISPKLTTASTGGTTISYIITVKSVQNFDDIAHLSVTNVGLPLSYQMPIGWFDWNVLDVRIPANTQVSVPLVLTIPPGQTAGNKSLKVMANSTFWITKGFDTGIITILWLKDTINPTIDSVAVYPANTTAGSKVDIKVAASDNEEVTGVTADDYVFTYSDGYWKGNITASSSPGKYNILIKAKDAAGNTVTTTVFYTVVKPTGSVGVGISPKLTTASTGGTTISYTVTVKSVQNFDDIAHLVVTNEGLPLSYQMPSGWFDWNVLDVRIPANTQVSVPLVLTIPSGQTAGKRALKVNANSTLWITKGFDTGIITIS